MKNLTRYFYLSALAVVLVGGVAIFSNHLGIATKLINFSFLILVLSTATYLFGIKRENEK